MDQDDDAISHLQELNTRLTKKAIRKPNISDTSEEFAALARELDTQSAFSYSGLVNLNRARAERLVSNPVAESDSLKNAGKSFSQSWNENVKQIGLPDTGLEANIMINSLVQSSRVYLEFGDPLLASKRLCELGDLLLKGGQFSNAVSAYQKASVTVSKDSIENAVYTDRLMQARTQLLLSSDVDNNALEVIGQANFYVPTLSEELQIHNSELSVTMFLFSLLRIAIFIRSSFPMIPVSSLLNFSSKRVSQEIAPKSANFCDVSYAEDCDALNRFLSNYPGCWKLANGQLLRALAEAVWWRDSHAALAVEHVLLPRLTGSQTQRDLCALIVSCLVSPVL